MDYKPRTTWIWHSSFKEKGASQDVCPQITSDFVQNSLSATNYLIVRHTLYRGGKPFVTEHRADNTETREEFRWIGQLPDPIRYVIEFFFNCGILLRYRCKVIYSFDPLCTAAPILLKKMGLVKEVYFFSPDFALKRFANPILNKVYFSLDKFCTTNCDLNICNSPHVIEAKKRLYGISSSSKFFLLPNVPLAESVNKFASITKKRHQIVYASQLSDDSVANFKILFGAINEASKTYPDIKLVIVGDGPKRSEIAPLANEHVSFAGLLSHDEALRVIAESEVGIALYDGGNQYDAYRDSLKIREYQALGTVPIITDVVRSNVEEIRRYGSGLILVNFNESSMRTALMTALDSAKLVELQRKARLNHTLQQNVFDQFLVASGLKP